jgi:FkbM family methyltransferase
MLGAGSANLDFAQTGEVRLLEELRKRWSGRDSLVVLDVGSNDGAYATAVRSVLGPRVRLECFEPDTASFEALHRRLGDQDGVRCHRLALGAEPGLARLYSNRAGSPLASLNAESFRFTSVEVASSQEVQVETVDRIVRELEISRVDLLKVDVEGHELAVLRGAAELIRGRNVEVVQFEFGARNVASRSFLWDFVEVLGDDYELVRVRPRGPVRLEYRPEREMFSEETNYAALLLR